MHVSVRIMVVVVAFAVAGCSSKSASPPNPSAVEAEPVQAAPEAAKAEAAPVKQEAPVSANDRLRQDIREWVNLAKKCDAKWFAAVDPSKLDKWELPVDVQSMEDMCDKLIFGQVDLAKTALFKGRALDSLVRRTALATDMYTHVALRSRKVGVKDKLPFKKMLTELRDRLRAEVAGIVKDADAVLALDDAKLVEDGSVEGTEMIAWADGNLRRVGSDMDTLVAAPRKEIGPLWRYSLIVSRVLVAKSSDAINSAKSDADVKVKLAASELSTAWLAYADFFIGDFLPEEEIKTPKLTKPVKKAIAKYEKVAGKVVGGGK